MQQIRCQSRWKSKLGNSGSKSVADPGFPIGGVPTRWGGANLQHVHFLAKTYAKTKEMDPVGGACTSGAPLDPPM